MLVIDALNSLLVEHDLEHTTQLQHKRAVRRFSEYLGRPATLDDLTLETINQWIIWLGEKKKLSPGSVLNHRSSIVRIWNYCADTLGTVGECPTRRIRRPKRPARIVRAWTLSELELLLTAAKDLPGRLRCGMKASDFMLAWLWVGYETGLRPIDLRGLQWQNIDFATSTITVVQHKTGCVHTAYFGPESAKHLQSLLTCAQNNVFPLCHWGIRRWEAILYRRAAKFGFTKLPHMGLGTLRKTHATEIYRQYGLAAAAESLGHASGTRMAREHYVDSRVQRRFSPPSPNARTG